MAWTLLIVVIYSSNISITTVDTYSSASCERLKQKIESTVKSKVGYITTECFSKAGDWK